MKARLLLLFFAAVMLAAQPQPSEPLLFTLWGKGTGTADGIGGSLQGTSKTNLMGTASFTITFVNGNLLGENGGGLGTCSLQNGSLQVTTSQGTISMSQVGTSCNVTNGTGPNTITGTYLVTQGTGTFKGTTGTGSVVASVSSSTGSPATGLIRLDGLLVP